MSEAAPENSQPTEDPKPDAAAETPPAEEPKAEETDWKAEARKWEQRAKDNKKAADELDKQRKAAMTDAERAAVEAEERGRTAATQEFGKELARERFDSLAARRNKDYDPGPALELVDLGKFLGDDGRPDTQAIESAVERLVPAPTNAPPSYDGGSRTTPPASDGMTGLIRKAAGRA